MVTGAEGPATRRRKRAIVEALGYSAETAAPNEKPRTEYMTDRWAQRVCAALLGVVEHEVALERTMRRAAVDQARSAGYADGYDRAVKVVRAAVRAARDNDPSTYNVWSRVGAALDEAELKAPPLHPSPDPDPPLLSATEEQVRAAIQTATRAGLALAAEQIRGFADDIVKAWDAAAAHASEPGHVRGGDGS